MLSATNMNAVLLARFKSNPHYSTLKKKKKKNADFIWPII